jgi:hypothetical protein
VAFSFWIMPNGVKRSLTARWCECLSRRIAQGVQGVIGYAAVRLRSSRARVYYILIAALASVFPLAVRADPADGGDAHADSPATLLPSGALHTNRSQIVDQYNRPVRLACTGLYDPDTHASSIDAQLR